jgi:methionyl-tRNA formyltransferase
MKIAFVGTGDFGAATLRALAPLHTLTHCISQPDRPAGRGRDIPPTPIRAAAEELGLPHLQTADINALPPADAIGGAELVFVVAFGQKIGGALLRAAPRGWVNLHASLLPRHRGAAPYQWAILSGDRVTGCTLFRLDEKWDAGPVLGMRETPIGELETADELHDRLALLGAELAVDVLNQMQAGSLSPVMQDATRATRAPKLRKTDGRIDWSQPAPAVQRRIHGLWSWPAAACHLVSPAAERDEPATRLQLARAAIVDDSHSPSADEPPGTVRPDGVVQCNPGRIRLLEVRPAGGKLMPFDAFARGRRLTTAALLATAEPAP